MNQYPIFNTQCTGQDFLNLLVSTDSFYSINTFYENTQVSCTLQHVSVGELKNDLSPSFQPITFSAIQKMSVTGQAGPDNVLIIHVIKYDGD